jgi:hypothetical protein
MYGGRAVVEGILSAGRAVNELVADDEVSPVWLRLQLPAAQGPTTRLIPDCATPRCWPGS